MRPKKIISKSSYVYLKKKWLNLKPFEMTKEYGANLSIPLFQLIPKKISTDHRCRTTKGTVTVKSDPRFTHAYAPLNGNPPSTIFIERWSIDQGHVTKDGTIDGTAKC